MEQEKGKSIKNKSEHKSDSWADPLRLVIEIETSEIDRGADDQIQERLDESAKERVVGVAFDYRLKLSFHFLTWEDFRESKWEWKGEDNQGPEHERCCTVH